MLGWALMFLVVAIIAGVFGFTGISMVAADFARILFFIFLVLFLVSLIFGLFRRGRPRLWVGDGADKLSAGRNSVHIGTSGWHYAHWRGPFIRKILAPTGFWPIMPPASPRWRSTILSTGCPQSWL